MKKIKLFDLKASKTLKKNIIQKFKILIKNQNFVKGKSIEKFENTFSNKINSNFCISCNSGTDALLLSLKSIDIKKNDEIITTAHSWISTSEVIKNLGAKPIFIDTNKDFNIDENLIEKKITKKTKAIIVVHLFGKPANLDKIISIKKKYNLKLIEDCAQSHFSRYKKRYTGTFGDLAAFSFFPTKNLGCYGDGGCIVTNNHKLANKVRMIANHGTSDRKNFIFDGINSRLDTIQSLVLLEKLKNINYELNHKNKLKKTYYKYLSGLKEVVLPSIEKNKIENYYLFTIKCKKRDMLKNFLKQKNIDSGIYYDFLLPLLKINKISKKEHFPVAIKNQNAMLSLPINGKLKISDIKYISSQIKEFYNQN